MKWIVPIAVVCCVAQADAAITLEQLQHQATVVQAALLQYHVAHDELTQIEAQRQAAHNRWQALSSLAALYYGAGYYDRGDYYQSAAVVEQAEYDRLGSVIMTKKAGVENLWQTYLREYARLQAMLAEYKGG